MKDAGCAHMGVGFATGKDKATEAAKMAISSPLLETSIKGAKGILINVTASPDIGLDECEIASSMVEEEAAPDAMVIWGTTFDASLEDAMNLTVIATGFDSVDGGTTAARPVSKPSAAAPASAPAEADDEESDVKKDDGISEEDFGDIINILKKSRGQQR